MKFGHYCFLVFFILMPPAVFSQSDSVRITELLNTIANNYRSKPDTCISLCKNVLGLIEEGSAKKKRSWHNDKKIETLDFLATIYYTKGDLTSSLDYYNRLLDMNRKKNDSMAIAGTFYGLGETYMGQGNVPKAIDAHSKALSIYEAKKDTHHIALELYSLGGIYHGQGDTARSNEYHTRSLSLFEAINDTWGICLLKNRLGNIYLKKGDYNKALEYFRANLKIYSEADMPGGTKGDQWGIAYSLEFIGKVYDKKNENDTAISYYLRALKIMEDMRHKSGVALSLIEIAQVYNKKGDKEKAEEYATRSLGIAKEVGYPTRIEQCAKLLNNLYAQKGDYKNAYEMLKLTTLMHDSIQNEDNRKAAYRQEINYEFEKKEAQAKQELELKEYRQFWIQVICVIIFIVLAVLALIMYKRYKTKKRTNEELEEKNRIIEDKNKDITDSINYAKRIQDAMLPVKEIKYRIFPDAFVLFAPKDVVSGDFYWFCEKNNKRLIAAVDCTGHGVPGAFMSMIGNAFLNEIVVHKGITEPGQILSELRYRVIEALKQKGAEGETRDGMDMALLSFDTSGSVEFAGANNPVWICRKENGKYSLEEIKGEKRPIGFFHGKGLPFANHTIKLFKGDSLYVFTDGYTDQFGGPKGKKFKYKQLQELLLSIQEKSMKEQETILEQTFKSWKGGLEQVDDVLVIGVRV